MSLMYIYWAVLKGYIDNARNTPSITRSVFKGLMKPAFFTPQQEHYYLVYLFKQLINISRSKVVTSASIDSLVITDKANGLDQNKMAYLSFYFNVKEPREYAIGDKTVGTNVDKLIVMLIFIGLLPLLLLLYFLIRDKKQRTVVVRELLYSIFILLYAKRQNVKDIFAYGTAFRSGMNLIAYLSNKKGLRFYKICSSNPLYLHYQYNVSTTFVCTSPSQIEELKNESFIENWYVDDIKLLPNPKSIALNSYFRAIAPIYPPPAYPIGFITSGFFIRNYRNHNKVSGESFYQAEELLIDFLNLHLKTSAAELLILLHPLEKRQENYAIACEYYQNKLHDVNYVIGDQQTNSMEYIKAANVFISSSSTLNYDLLYCGAKVIFAPLGNPKAMFPNYSALNKVSAKTPEELKRLISHISHQGISEYYAENGLTAFHHSQYKASTVKLNHIKSLSNY